jgi:hypothetical protein
VSPRHQSERWQLVVSIPEDVIENYLKATIQLGDELTAAGFLRLAKSPKRQAIAPRDKGSV